MTIGDIKKTNQVNEKKEDISDSDGEPDPNFFDRDDKQIDSSAKKQKTSPKSGVRF
jgi:hypothetical protein